MMDFQSSMNLDEPTRPPKPTAPLPRISSYFYACRDRNLDTREKCTTLYPCDGARIQVSFTENQHTRNDFKTLWSWNENIVSWGSYSRSIYGAYVTAVFRDQTVFTCAYPQPENTVATSVPTQPPATAIPTVQISTSDGLVVQFLPSGNVLQRFVPPKARAKAAVSGTRGVLDRAIGKEIGRVFTYKGAIVRYMEDDMVITQFPNGAYSSKTGNVWTTIRVDGSRVVGSSICLTSQQQQPAETSEQAAVDPSVTDAAENAKVDAPNANQGGVEELPRIRVSQETNLSSKELMITREDLVHVAVREEFGIVSCTHADGSTIESRFALGRLESAEELLGRTDPESIKIHAGSFATVAFGEFVGGGIERKPGRVSLTLPDGTSVEYGVKNAEHVALRDDVMVSVNMKGHMKITKQYLNKTSTRSDPPSRRRTAKSATVPESKPVTPGKVEEAHSYSANWFDGTLHHVDAFGTVFEVDRFGNASVRAKEGTLIHPSELNPPT
ncbi:hypothetical protein BJ742DRAFT_131946 [Cladochytrium replicatum]|nr:hypothetical protein BJ742DRAFT_131946 [Cladochytrium replicatum]